MNGPRQCAAPGCRNPVTGRADARTCSPKCRQALARFKRTKRGKRVERERKARERRAQEASTGPGSLSLAHCPVAELIPRGIVEPGSVDCVFTDPPYPREFLSAWADLARFAAAALKPGGMLAALSGHSWIPEVLACLDAPGLSYRWTLSLHLPGASAAVVGRRMNTNWKPVFVYHAQRLPADAGMMPDTIAAPARQRQADLFHNWGQGPGAMDALAKRLLIPGWRVCDPFGGGGETALAAWRRGCHVLAADADAEAVDTMRATLLSVTESVTPKAA